MPSKRLISIRKDKTEYPVGKECHLHFRDALKSCYGQNWEFAELPKDLQKDIYFMSEAILKDPVLPYSINDLGLSQAYRLYEFLNPEKALPNVSLEELGGLPTIGAEFNFPITPKNEELCKKIFLANMSQYHRDSMIPLSGGEGNWKIIQPFIRLEENIANIRMNPSYYPITIANWGLMKKFFPLNDATFSLTITPLPKDDSDLQKLRSLMNIVYANDYFDMKKEWIPCKKRKNHEFKHPLSNVNPFLGFFSIFETMSLCTLSEFNELKAEWAGISTFISVLAATMCSCIIKKENSESAKYGELSFGDYYFGLTQKLDNGKYSSNEKANRLLNGMISDIKKDQLNLHPNFGKIEDYQLNLYSGFGKIFPKQAYYASMAYLDGEILDIVNQHVGKEVSVDKAVNFIDNKVIKNVLRSINDYIGKNPNLKMITHKGQRIIDSFRV